MIELLEGQIAYRFEDGWLFPRAFDLADVQQKLKQLLRAIDAHPVVVEQGSLDRTKWNGVSVST